MNLEQLTERMIDRSQNPEAQPKVKTRRPAIRRSEVNVIALSSEDIDTATDSKVSKVKLRKGAYKAAFPVFAKIFGKPVDQQAL